MTEQSDVVIREARWPADAEALQGIRSAVFIIEQGVPRRIEWDGQDASATHVIAHAGEHPVGCGRLLPDGRIGRLAVLSSYRGQHIGARLLDLLVTIARRRADMSVYLHAQADAVAFYERAGFQPRGEPFEEAGIQHLDMYLDLDYRDCDEPLVKLRYPQPFAQLVVAQARLARRELRILSPRLDGRVFDNEELEDAIRSLLRQGRMSRVQILVQDARSMVQRGHRLLKLARRLPSSVEMRKLREHPDWNGDTLVVRDRDSLLALPAGDTDPGFYRPGDRARCQSEIARFDELWRVAEVDPEFRALSI
jgi:predicted GNAT family N-acyltransferase